MSQSWYDIATAAALGDALQTQVPANFLALLTDFSGGSLPTANLQPYMRAVYNGIVYQRNAANNAWVPRGRADSDWTEQSLSLPELLSLAATRQMFLPPSRVAGAVRRIVVVSDTASTDSSGNEWQFGLRNMTTSVELFSGTVGTFTSLGGVGGGTSLVANQVWALTPNQNKTFNADAVLRLTITKVGAATTLARASVFAELSRTE